MRNILIAGLLSVGSFAFGQEQESNNKKDLRIKANLLTLPISMINVGVEQQISEHYTVQADVFVSPWKSFAGKHAQAYLVGFDGRYYFSKAFEKFYIGANVSGGFYNIQKWNYWNDNFYVHKNGEVTPYINSNLYQKGYTFILGAVGGYQFQWNDHWGLDIYLGIGTMQSFYKGYDKVTGDRYDTLEDRAGNDLDQSGEWLPYRGGVMLTYKL
ncbi:DUF3575 domain-containing protein [Soonwooa sp.]|uniref:DUF3575 domain-containing protein n=1 Tax=Soonwooa sp. TaxID=1938592 RepID=UPI0028979505|nr:DUF3575 domain-containing protein [Soonwooa sp.]